MPAFQFLSHRGKTVAFVDLAHANSEEVAAVTQEAAAQIEKMPKQSVLILTDVTESVYNQATSAAMKEFSRHNTPFTRASAVIGISPMQSVLLQAITVLTGRHIRVCKDREEALDWLASQ